MRSLFSALADTPTPPSVRSYCEIESNALSFDLWCFDFAISDSASEGASRTLRWQLSESSKNNANN